MDDDEEEEEEEDDDDDEDDDGNCSSARAIDFNNSIDVFSLNSNIFLFITPNF